MFCLTKCKGFFLPASKIQKNLYVLLNYIKKENNFALVLPSHTINFQTLHSSWRFFKTQTVSPENSEMFPPWRLNPYIYMQSPCKAIVSCSLKTGMFGAFNTPPKEIHFVGQIPSSSLWFEFAHIQFACEVRSTVNIAK